MNEENKDSRNESTLKMMRLGDTHIEKDITIPGFEIDQGSDGDDFKKS